MRRGSRAMWPPCASAGGCSRRSPPFEPYVPFAKFRGGTGISAVVALQKAQSFSQRNPHYLGAFMAGHSQFKNIMYRKGAQDKKRPALFASPARELTVAAKSGSPAPAASDRLRIASANARAQNMPKDNIERARKKAQGSEIDNYDEVRYEGFGPGGVSLIIDRLTDNRNRTAGEIRSAFSKNGGSLGEMGSVSYQFDRVGQVVYPAEVGDADTVFEAALEAGADDVSSDDETHEIYCAA